MDERGNGWIVFAAIMLGVAGIMWVFDAIWAFRYHGALPENLENVIFGHSLKTYGWTSCALARLETLVSPGPKDPSGVDGEVGPGTTASRDDGSEATR